MCHAYAYGTFLAEDFNKFIWVFLKNEKSDLHEILTAHFYSFLSKIWKNLLIWTSISEIEKSFRHPRF